MVPRRAGPVHEPLQRRAALRLQPLRDATASARGLRHATSRVAPPASRVGHSLVRYITLHALVGRELGALWKAERNRAQGAQRAHRVHTKEVPLTRCRACDSTSATLTTLSHHIHMTVLPLLPEPGSVEDPTIDFSIDAYLPYIFPLVTARDECSVRDSSLLYEYEELDKLWVEPARTVQSGAGAPPSPVSTV